METDAWNRLRKAAIRFEVETGEKLKLVKNVFMAFQVSKSLSVLMIKRASASAINRTRKRAVDLGRKKKFPHF